MESTIGSVIGGLIVGAIIGVVAEPFMSAMAEVARPVAKEVVKGGLIVAAAASDFVGEVQNQWSSLVTEAKTELEAASPKQLT